MCVIHTLYTCVQCIVSMHVLYASVVCMYCLHVSCAEREKIERGRREKKWKKIRVHKSFCFLFVDKETHHQNLQTCSSQPPVLHRKYAPKHVCWTQLISPVEPEVMGGGPGIRPFSGTNFGPIFGRIFAKLLAV